MTFDSSSIGPESGSASAAPLVLPLGEIGEDLLPLVGGKALNLGRMVRLGFPVPEGFCVTTRAYEGAARVKEVQPLLERLQELPAADLGRLRELAGRIRRILAAGRLPAPVFQAISGSYARMGGDGVAVAVRSSATAEDLPGSSFAGQQDSYLNVTGAVRVAEEVRRCWVSLWSDRATIYRAERRIDQRSVRMAVVVQRLVDARAAGVLFTANPISGSRREAVVDAAPGLGEAVVSGSVVPDHFVVGTDGATVIEERRGKNELIIRPLPQGGVERSAPEAPSSAPCIDRRELADIVRLGRSIARFLKGPQDVEWAIDGEGKRWILQARPITTLFPLPAGAPEPAGDLRAYYSLNASQGMERPFTPLGASVFRLLISAVASCFGFPPADRLAGPSFLTEAAGRLYIDVTGALRSAVGRRLLAQMVSGISARAGASIERLTEDPSFSPIYRSPLPLLRHALSFVIRSGLYWHLVQSIVHPQGTRLRVRRLRAAFEAAAARLESTPIERRPEAVQRLFSAETVRGLLGIMPSVLLPARGFLWLGRRLLQGLATDGEIQTCLRAAPGNPTTEMDIDLWDLAVQAGKDEPLAETLRGSSPQALARGYREGRLPVGFREALVAFLRRHGHRCATELDAGLKRWSEDPAPLFASLAGYLRQGSRIPGPRRILGRGAQQAEAMIADLALRARGRGRARAAVVRLCLRRARALSGLQEVPRSYIALLFALARTLLEPAGRELLNAGRLADETDLSFLSLREMREALGRGSGPDAATLRRRKATYEAEVARREHPAILLSDGTRPELGATPGDAADGPGVLRGIPASAGTVRGKARVLLDPEGARLAPGEILVAPSTDPGWTPLFVLAGGLVMETGGPMAHGSIAAREYGIPAVVGVVGATVSIRDEQELVVEGTSGRVIVVGSSGT